jgi:hypothetical protein
MLCPYMPEPGSQKLLVTLSNELAKRAVVYTAPALLMPYVSKNWVYCKPICGE